MDWDWQSATIYWHQVNSLSWNATRTAWHYRNTIWWLNWYALVWSNFTFEWGEKIWNVINAKFNWSFVNWGSSQWGPAVTVTPSIYLVHMDWTLSEEIEYTPSEPIGFKWLVTYMDTSDSVLTATKWDRLVLKLASTLISWSTSSYWLYNHNSEQEPTFNNWYPVQISVE